MLRRFLEGWQHSLDLDGLLLLACLTPLLHDVDARRAAITLDAKTRGIAS
jgi:hypothetical protein